MEQSKKNATGYLIGVRRPPLDLREKERSGEVNCSRSGFRFGGALLTPPCCKLDVELISLSPIERSRLLSQQFKHMWCFLHCDGRHPPDADSHTRDLLRRLLLCRLSPPVIQSRRAEMPVPKDFLNDCQVNAVLQQTSRRRALHIVWGKSLHSCFHPPALQYEPNRVAPKTFPIRDTLTAQYIVSFPNEA
jgi:hypothetical protein